MTCLHAWAAGKCIHCGEELPIVVELRAKVAELRAELNRMTDRLERSPATAEQRRIDENARKAAKEIVDGQKLETLEEAKRFAQNWIETAAQHSRNEEYFRKGRDEARAALARLVKNHDSETYVSRERRRAAYSAARTLLADTGPGNVCLACGALLPHDASSYCANGWKTTASVEAAADQPAPPGPAAASTSAEFDEKLRWTAVYEAGVAEGRRLGASVEAAAGVPGQSGPGAASTPVTRCQTCSVPILKGTRFCESCLAKWIAARSGREVPNEDDLNVAREIFETHLFKAKIHAPRSGEKMRLARMMTDAEIASELESLGKKWDAFRDSDDEGHGGSPGEWMVERMGELETEQKRRSAVAVFQGE